MKKISFLISLFILTSCSTLKTNSQVIESSYEELSEIKQISKINNIDFMYFESDSLYTFNTKETINDLVFKYNKYSSLVGVLCGKIYSLKQLYKDVKINSENLNILLQKYNNLISFDENEEYKEINGEAIVLERKEKTQLKIYEHAYDYLKDLVYIEIEKPFYDLTFTIDDFKGIKDVSFSDYHLSMYFYENKYICLNVKNLFSRDLSKLSEKFYSFDFVYRLDQYPGGVIYA